MRVVHRRRGAVGFYLVLAAALVVVAVAVTPGEVRTAGWRGAVLPWSLAVPAAVIAVLAGVMPRLVTTDEGVEVHNMFTRFTVAYPGVAELRAGRRGLALALVGGRSIPVVAFGHSAFATMLTGDAAAGRALHAVNDRLAHRIDPTGPPEPVHRQRKPVELTLAVVALLALVLGLTLG
jgi:hypothetical protein